MRISHLLTIVTLLCLFIGVRATLGMYCYKDAGLKTIVDGAIGGLLAALMFELRA